MEVSQCPGSSNCYRFERLAERTRAKTHFVPVFGVKTIFKPETSTRQPKPTHYSKWYNICPTWCSCIRWLAEIYITVTITSTHWNISVRTKSLYPPDSLHISLQISASSVLHYQPWELLFTRRKPLAGADCLSIVKADEGRHRNSFSKFNWRMNST